MTKIAIILPAFNEALTIGETIREFHTACPNAELWIINNNSSDETENIATQQLIDLGATGSVITETRQGKGNAVRRAFHDIDADIYVMADADLTYPAERINDLIQPIINGYADMVVGDRHSTGHYQEENKRPLHNFGNKLVQSLVNKLFKANLVDIMTGYRAFNRCFVKSYPIMVEGFEIETDMTLHALDKRFKIIEIPIEYRDRPAGSISKLNTLSDGTKVIITIARILRYYRPLTFFGGAALIVGLSGLIVAIPVLNDWIQEQYIYHIPLAILATGLEIIAMLLIAIGLILDSITYQNKCTFELDQLNK